MTSLGRFFNASCLDLVETLGQSLQHGVSFGHLLSQFGRLLSRRLRGCLDRCALSLGDRAGDRLHNRGTGGLKPACTSPAASASEATATSTEATLSPTAAGPIGPAGRCIADTESGRTASHRSHSRWSCSIATWHDLSPRMS